MTNILFLMTDQQRWDTIDSNSGWVKTPNLDRIAQEGVRFDNCITTTPICMPARLTLATGQYPHNNHVWTNVNHTMSADADNWMREIKKLGYRTSLFGKTHLYPHGKNDMRAMEPLVHAWGLDDINEIGGPQASRVGMSHMTAMWQNKGLLESFREDLNERSRNKVHVARPSALPLVDYYDTYVGQQAKQYLADYDREEPWFCWVSFAGPHSPWDAPEPYASMYDPDVMPKPATHDGDGPEPYRPARWNLESGDIAPMRANYAGNVTLIDDQIGEILAVIESRGELADTVIAFTSDHGEMNGDHGLSGKSNFYDGAIRVPLIIRAPGRTRAGCVNPALVEMCDLGPTLVELAGGAIGYQQFARSLAGVLEGGSHREDALSEYNGEFMLMTDTWKMALNRQGETCMLFNRFDDPGEERNLAAVPEYQADVDAMRQRLLVRITQSQLQAQ